MRIFIDYWLLVEPRYTYL